MKKGAIILGGIILLVVIFGFFQKEKNYNEKFVQKVTTFKVREASDSVEHVFGATVKNIDEATLAAQVSGNVSHIYVNEGDVIKKGQLLATLNAGEYVAQYNQAQTMVEVAQKEEQLARRKWDEYKPEEREQIKLGVTRAESARAEASAHLAKTRITAPFDGVVSTKFVRAGSTVLQGSSIIRVIGNTSEIEVVFDVSRDVSKELSVDDMIIVKNEMQDSSAKIYAIDPVANEQTRKTRIHAELIDKSVFVAGDFVKIYVNTSMDGGKGVIIPAESIVRFYDDEVVFSFDENGFVHLIPVKVLHVGSDGAVVDGISVDDEIVVSGAQLVNDGDSVDVVNEK